ncbi:MAG: O-antigen ligase family protein [Candidatus Eisenbacteria bacterium]
MSLHGSTQARVFSSGVGPARHRPFLLGALALFVSTSAGLAIARLPPLLVLGGIAACLGCYAVLRRPFLGLLLYTILYMWRPGEAYNVLTGLHLERLVGAVTLVALAFGQLREHGKIRIDDTPLSRRLMLLAFAATFSLPFSYWLSASLAAFIDFLKLLAWYLLIVHLIDSRGRLRIFMVVYLIALSKLTIDAIRAYAAGNFQYAQGIDRLVGQNDAAGDPNHFAASCVATIPLLLLLPAPRKWPWIRCLSLGLAILFGVALTLTGSRSGMLALLGALLALWWRGRRRARGAFLIVGLLISCLAVLPEEYRIRYSTITSSELDGSSSARIEAWKKGGQMILDRPLSGVGLGCFGVANALGYSSENRRSWLQAHSLYVQVPSELGVPGALFFFSFVAAMIRSCRKLRPILGATGESWRFECSLLAAIPSGIVGLLVAGVFGHSLMRYTWYVYGALVVAIGHIAARRPSSLLEHGLPVRQAPPTAVLSAAGESPRCTRPDAIKVRPAVAGNQPSEPPRDNA